MLLRLLQAMIAAGGNAYHVLICTDLDHCAVSECCPSISMVRGAGQDRKPWSFGRSDALLEATSPLPGQGQ